jgi:hypothetical protein
MTPMNPAMVEMVARARVSEMRHTAARRSHGGPRHDAGHIGRAAKTRVSAVRTRSIRPQAPRRAIGYFLINLGLRLVLPLPTEWVR